MCHNLFAGLLVGRQASIPVVDVQMEMYKQIQKMHPVGFMKRNKIKKKRGAGKLNVELAPVYTV